jgi:hypothetical protein
MARHECGKRIYPDQDTALSFALRHAGRYGKPMRAYPPVPPRPVGLASHDPATEDLHHYPRGNPECLSS